MIDTADSWLDEAWRDRHQLAAAFLAMFLTIRLRQDFATQAAAFFLAYIVVGMLADLVGLVEALHDCVHTVAEETAATLSEALGAPQSET